MSSRWRAWTDRALRGLSSVPNGCGLVLAALPLLLKGAGLLGPETYLLALGGYLAGFTAGGLLFGFPVLGKRPWEDELSFDDSGDARQVIDTALSGIRSLVRHNPDQRLSNILQQRVLGLCDRLEGLLSQWEGSKGTLSLEEEFHARHLASAYLPQALKTYLSIPKDFASERLLENGRTAHDTLVLALDDLSTKVGQLADDLAGQDAQAFLAHSRFLDEKFGTRKQALR
ncbi:hypothetical protein [Candidatus Accumulibacter vicinus]|uniref:5-bromo-4-chloroindolyl phosphate hydrolysis protein n=1 Tax=Candidatus Accumulibacter vicinus TaxID=2954382 RepID=A0A084Y0P6_9PROT|nr:hypothetical protein [Candidatus Accumulibacter vicinus]KFB68290.1 MAG: hypothetical protein CAPSK01_002143 [Candidatus Accumulibacter vicinus]